jgi:hypothetical protein
MTELAVDLLIKKLKTMTSDVGEQVEIINQSIMNGWQGIFPLKEQKKYGYKEKVPGWMGFTMGDEEKSFIEQALKDDPATPEEQEQLRRELQESFGRK